MSRLLSEGLRSRSSAGTEPGRDTSPQDRSDQPGQRSRVLCKLASSKTLASTSKVQSAAELSVSRLSQPHASRTRVARLRSRVSAKDEIAATRLARRERRALLGRPTDANEAEPRVAQPTARGQWRHGRRAAALRAVWLGTTDAPRRGHGLFAQHGRVVRSVGGLRRGSSKTDSTVIVLSVIPEDSFSGSLVLLHLYIGLLS